MLKKFQETIANDINGIANPWAKYSAWGGYWLAHGVTLAIALGIKLSFWILKVGASVALPAPPAKKKKKH